MKMVVISRPVEIVAGSGLALVATVATFGSPVIQSRVEVSTDSTDLVAPIVTIIGLTVA